MKAIKKTKEVQTKEAGVQVCIWSEEGIISSRGCTRRLECNRCLFDQNMMDYFTADLTRLPAVPQAA